ncbi:MAG TPA: hypothetical protein VEQ63_13905, partial [Bryobacteraceae bacterium]|nr:hypothetical protein [Bryobacteraceae bacterium]
VLILKVSRPAKNPIKNATTATVTITAIPPGLLKTGEGRRRAAKARHVGIVDLAKHCPADSAIRLPGHALCAHLGRSPIASGSLGDTDLRLCHQRKGLPIAMGNSNVGSAALRGDKAAGTAGRPE